VRNANLAVLYDKYVLACAVRGRYCFWCTLSVLCKNWFRFVKMNFAVRYANQCKEINCIRIGPRCRNSCVDIMTTDGSVICWSTAVNTWVCLLNRARFKCSFSNAKLKFYRSTNAIFSKIGRLSSEEVLLIYRVQMSTNAPVRYGGLSMNKTDIQQLNFHLQDCSWNYSDIFC